MRADIEGWLAACTQCQLAARPNQKTHHAPMKPLDVPPVFSHWHLDFIGELPTMTNGNRWLLVAVDYATNWTIAHVVLMLLVKLLQTSFMNKLYCRFLVLLKSVQIVVLILCPMY